ncbi:MAG: hypothetical protein CVV27_20490 [Candidatus Melainabacteria bacterium HGW-Melainabacteria-1]|nr:MAG: hypothetical protein CVV27_20490 [Candidatus Melainabacteria bacterium HGW-Melainabacteria-1]
MLKNIQRENISLDSYRELQNRFRADGIATYTDILVGLPGETYASFASSLSRVIDEGQHHLIRFYNVSLLPNAEMAQPEYRARHGLETVEILHVEPLAPTRIDIPETQEIVIATRCLSKPDWVRMRVMAWWAELVYFNRKLLQVPIALLNLAGVPYADTFCYLVDGNWPQTQIMSQIRQFLCHKARAIQQGDSELCAAQIPGQRDMWLTVEEHLVTGLCQTLAWNAFFDDAKVIFDELLLRQGKTLPPHVLEEALTLSSCLLQGIILEKPFDLPVSSNFWQVYQGVLSGHPLTLAPWQGRLSRNWAGHPYHQLKLIHETDLAGQSPPGTPSGAKMTGA